MSAPGPAAATRVFALLGDPVSHSLSPRFQNAAIEQLALDGIYVALRCDAGDAQPLLRALARAGGGGNVTVPHKERVVAGLERRTAAVDRTGACNCFWLEDGRVCGDNTDVDGFRAALPRAVAGAAVLVLGAGGAARAAVDVLLADDAGRILLHNRTAARARALAERFHDRRIEIVDRLDDLAVDLVVNTTSLGLRDDDPPPLDLDRLGEIGGVVDVVCRPGRTALVAHATALGIPARDGREMLVRQGAAAFERWWKREAPLDVMRRALDEALA